MKEKGGQYKRFLSQKMRYIDMCPEISTFTKIQVKKFLHEQANRALINQQLQKASDWDLHKVVQRL